MHDVNDIKDYIVFRRGRDPYCLWLWLSRPTSIIKLTDDASGIHRVFETTSKRRRAGVEVNWSPFIWCVNFRRVCYNSTGITVRAFYCVSPLFFNNFAGSLWWDGGVNECNYHDAHLYTWDNITVGGGQWRIGRTQAEVVTQTEVVTQESQVQGSVKKGQAKNSLE